MTKKRINVLSKFVPNIISGDKDLTFRLKKEGEFWNVAINPPKKGKSCMAFTVKHAGVFRENLSPKFMNGETYSICVDEEPVWYCPKCNKEAEFDVEVSTKYIKNTLGARCGCKEFITIGPCSFMNCGWKKLRIKVLSIREQKLLDVTNADAERSVGKGFKYPRQVFFSDFWECYKDLIPIEILKKANKKSMFECEVTHWQLSEWNPSVWRIEMEVVE